MNFSRIVVKLMVWTALLFVPNVLKSIMDFIVVEQSKTTVGSLNDLVMTQIALGVIYVFFAIVEFHKYAVVGECDEKNTNENKKQITKVSTEKKEEGILNNKKDSIKSNLVNLTKIAQEEIQSAIKQINKENDIPFNFKNNELNKLVIEILNKLEYLKNHVYIQKDIESALMVEKTEKEYILKIHKNYIDIPENKRGKNGIKNSPYNLTFKQLKLLISGLDEIENKIVKDSLMKQKINEKFLKEKVGSI